MQNRKTFLIKYLALMLILVSALLLSACRTRITNNNEVSNVYYDEDGYLSDTYEMRRSELSLSTAKKPLLPDFGPIEDEEEEFDTGESINYEPEEEEYVEPPEVQNANRTTNRTTRRYTSGTTGGGSSSRTTTERVTIKFDANVGKCNTTEKKVYKGSKIGTLPEATKDGKTTKTWCQNKDGSKPVTSDVIIDRDITLYAHWDEEKKPEKTITITFDANKGKNPPPSKKVKEGSTYGDIATLTGDISRDGYEWAGWSVKKEGAAIKATDKVPSGSTTLTLYAKWTKKEEFVKLTLDAKGGSGGGEIPLKKGESKSLPSSKKDGYIFRGWGTNPEGPPEYKAKDKITVDADITLYAIWENAYEYWNSEYELAMQDEDKVPVIIAPGLDDKGILNSLIESADDAEIVICFAIENDMQSEFDNLTREYTDKTIYVISSDALSDPNHELAYKIAMLKRLKDMELKGALNDLGVTVSIKED